MNFRNSNIEVPNGRPHASVASGDFLSAPDDRILITGAAGFIGSRVVANLLDRGFRNLVCFVRPSSDVTGIESIIRNRPAGARVEVVRGNLLSASDCDTACEGAAVIYHLAAGIGEKSYPDAYMNSVITTRNLLDSTLRCARLKRFVLVSSFCVYSNRQKSNRLDETCPTEERPELRGEAYCYAKVRQEQMVADYGRQFGVPYVVVRPGSVYGGASDITGRVGVGTFGLFLHLGGSNQIPLSYVENCAEAIVLAGIVKGVENEVFNAVDSDLPSSRQFLRQYKRKVRKFKSVYVPHVMSYTLCYLWEKYSTWSRGQLPLAFNRQRWYSDWRSTHYSNNKLKQKLGWTQKVPTPEAMNRYFQSCARGASHA